MKKIVAIVSLVLFALTVASPLFFDTAEAKGRRGKKFKEDIQQTAPMKKDIQY